MKVKQIREARNLSQGALARKARMSREHLNRLEAGRHDATISTLERIAKALGVPVTGLLE